MNFSWDNKTGFLQNSIFATPWTAARQASLSITNSRSLPKHCPLSRWCRPTISPSVVSFSSHLQSFPASGSFQMSRFITSGGQSIGVSASASVLPMNTQDWCPLGWPGWISSPTSRREHLPSLPSFVLDLEVLGFMAWLSINWILHPPFLGGLQPSQSNQVLIHVLKRNIMCHSSWTKSTASLLPDF